MVSNAARIGQLLEHLRDSPVAILLGVVVILLSALITITGGISVLYKLYRSSLGHKGALRRELRRLSAGVNINYFREILGSPVSVNAHEDKREYIFVNKYFYVQAIADSGENVLAFSVTTRSNRFNPDLKLGPYSLSGEALYIRLGKTKFAELDSFAKPTSIASSMGARRFHYYEEYYFGNPGDYQTYVFGVNDSGCPPWYGFNRWDTALGSRPKILDGWNNVQQPEVLAFRTEAAINTYTVVAPLLSLEVLRGYSFGPNFDQVRILDPKRALNPSESRRMRTIINLGPYELFKKRVALQRKPASR
jgi:hypothetical protein